MLQHVYNSRRKRVCYLRRGLVGPTLKKIALIIVLANSALGQSQQTATNATCSNTRIDAKGNVTFYCSGLSPSQAKLLQDIPALLNGLLRSEQRDTASIRKKLDECLEQMVGRVISDKQKAAMKGILAQFPGESIAIIAEGASDPGETFRYATQIATVFRDAGWNTLSPQNSPRSRPFSGFFIRSTSRSSPNRAVDIIAARNAVRDALSIIKPVDQLEIPIMNDELAQVIEVLVGDK